VSEKKREIDHARVVQTVLEESRDARSRLNKIVGLLLRSALKREHACCECCAKIASIVAGDPP